MKRTQSSCITDFFRKKSCLGTLVSNQKVNQNNSVSVYAAQDVTNVRVLADILATSQLVMGKFSELVKLITLYFTLSISTASAGRSFSALRRVKTYLQLQSIILLNNTCNCSL